MNSVFYCIYLPDTGEIVSSGFAPEHELPNQCKPPCKWLVTDQFYRNCDYMVENSKIVLLPTKPSNYHVFDYKTKQWKDPRTQKTQWPVVRDMRSQLLAASDWTQLPDVPLATKEAWATYRQALRDITNQPDPFTIQWPTQPE
jgi:hypothetical protein